MAYIGTANILHVHTAESGARTIVTQLHAVNMITFTCASLLVLYML